MADRYYHKNPKRARKKRLVFIVLGEILILFLLAGAYYFISNANKKPKTENKTGTNTSDQSSDTGNNQKEDDSKNQLTPEEQQAQKEQEQLKAELSEREKLITDANKLTVQYDYDGAIKLIKSYKGKEGGYEVYPNLVSAIKDLETKKNSLVYLGGSYTSVTQVNHIFFHTLIADTSKAFDGDEDADGYNDYMTTISEFNKIIQKMYDDGYVLVSIHDLVKQVKKDDGTLAYEEGDIYLPQGKKPFVLSQDDVSYYKYMDGDGFATRLVIGADGKITNEMKQDDGTVITGAFDVAPLIDEFVEKHPDFSYKGAKGILALTGYDGVLGYRTDDPTSPTYEQDKKDAKKVADAMKAEGWLFASHSWGHIHMQTRTFEKLKTDTERWFTEVEPIIGPTDILIFPFGEDIETTMGHYKSDKFKYLKEKGFNYYCGVYEKPWMHIKDDYVRMTRRPLDGETMLGYPERLTDLFNVKDILDPSRPPYKKP